MKIEVKKGEVTPEIVAAIMAAVQMMAKYKVVAVRIRRSSNDWSLSARGGRR